MNANRGALARGLIRLYPRQWCGRYGDEFLVLIGEHGLDARRTANIIRAAGDEWATLAVRRLLGSEREDAVIRRIAWWVVHVVLAWAAAMTVSAVFPVAATVVGVAVGICGWDLVNERAHFMFSDRAMSLGLLDPVFLMIALVMVPSVVVAFKLTRAGREMPRTARVATVAAVLFASALSHAWWNSYSDWWGIMSLSMLDSFLSLAAGGFVIACALFPRSAHGLTSDPPKLVPA
jgi:hypothetical protein